jgi:hypothetical protein
MKWEPIECQYSAELLDEAMARAADLGKLRNSIREGEGNTVGYIGEAVFNELFGGMLEEDKEKLYQYDVLHPELGKVEVKTKSTGVNYVKEHYEGSVAAFNPNQECDNYVFMRVNEDLRKAWFCGYIPKKYFVKYSKRIESGDHDARNDWTASAKCYNIEYETCNTMLETRLPPDPKVKLVPKIKVVWSNSGDGGRPVGTVQN